MLTPLNRAQLAAVFQQDRCQEIVRILTSTTSPPRCAPWTGLPSVFSMGTWERSGAPSRTPPRAGSTSSTWPGRTWKPPVPLTGLMESGRGTGKI